MEAFMMSQAVNLFKVECFTKILFYSSLEYHVKNMIPLVKKDCRLLIILYFFNEKEENVFWLH